jgi:hypothetical protein
LGRWDNPETGYPPASAGWRINWKGETGFPQELLNSNSLFRFWLKKMTGVKMKFSFYNLVYGNLISKMSLATLKNRTKLPNVLLISGNGRNVGKTTLACRIIAQFSKSISVTGLKISPHFHDFSIENVIFKNDNIVIVEENKINQKDSSLMLQAGAKNVYFVMVKPERLADELEHIISLLPGHLVVCEAGGLREFTSPGLFLMVKNKGDKIIKTQHMKYDPMVVNNFGDKFDFDVNALEFKAGKISLKNNNGRF